jgi:hypothetical protein
LAGGHVTGGKYFLDELARVKAYFISGHSFICYILLHLEQFASTATNKASKHSLGEKSVMLQGLNVELHGCPHIFNSFFSGLSLTDTSGKTGTFSYPIIIFTRIYNYQPHGFSCAHSTLLC